MELRIVRATLDFRNRVVFQRVDTAKPSQAIRVQRNLFASPVVFCFDSFILAFKRRLVGVAELIRYGQHQCAANCCFVQQCDQVAGRNRSQPFRQLGNFRIEKMLVIVNLWPVCTDWYPGRASDTSRTTLLAFSSEARAAFTTYAQIISRNGVPNTLGHPQYSIVGSPIFRAVLDHASTRW
jgi:hypothetical protein